MVSTFWLTVKLISMQHQAVTFYSHCAMTVDDITSYFLLLVCNECGCCDVTLRETIVGRPR